MKSVALSALCLLGALCLCASGTSTSQPDVFYNWLQAVGSIPEVLPCGGWDCECAFKRQRGCCCASTQLCEMEETIFRRMVGMWGQLTKLKSDIGEITGTDSHIAFTAAMSGREGCYGPFNSNRTISYNAVRLNQGFGYNPALGVFTAPRSGIYVFSFTAYSNVGNPNDRLYHKVQMMKNGVLMASMWEDNREDMEDSGTQVVVLFLGRGSQVYMELMNGRSLCGNTGEFNMFSGYFLYPAV